MEKRRREMKKMMITLGIMLMSGVVSADTFYLQADMGLNSTPLNKDLWWTAASGGTQMQESDTFGGSRFDLNGKVLRAPNATGTSTFGGTFVVSADAAKTTELMAAGWNVTGMDFNNVIEMRIRKPTVNLSVNNMVLGSSGDLSFRTFSATDANLNLSISNLSGSGALSFGGYSADTNGAWTVSITNESAFAGTMDLQYGELTFGNDFALNDGSFAINSALDNSVVLANSVSFSNVTYGASSLAIGEYDAADLNTEFGTTRFSGPGTVTVIPEPATIGMLGLGALIALLIRRNSRTS
jgi:hypothetical protein